MSLDVVIKLDQTNLVPELAKTQAGLEKVEAAGPKVGEALSKGMREGSLAADRTRKSISNLGSAFESIGIYHLNEGLRAGAKAFDGMTQAISKERDMLDRIHGPMLQLQEDVRVLDSLHRKGMITAREYSAQMQVSQQRAGTVSAPGNDNAAGGLGALAGGAAVGMIAHEVAKLTDEYGNLSNRLRAVATDDKNLTDLMGSTLDMANRTRSDWESTATVYMRLKIATRELGASQADVMQMTETLSKGLRMGGATAFEANMSMMELSHAFQVGSLSGREFRVMMKDAAPLMVALQHASGNTAAEFAEMGKHGKISASLMMEWFKKAKDEIDAGFAKTVPTISEQWLVFKNNLTSTIGKLAETSQLVPTLGTLLTGLTGVLAPLADGLGLVLGLLAKAGGLVHTLGEAVGVDLNVGIGTFIGMVAGGPMGAALGTLAEGVLKATSPMRDQIAVMKAIDETANGMMYTGGMFKEQWEKLNTTITRVNGGFYATTAALGQVHAAFSHSQDVIAGFTAELFRAIDGMRQVQAIIDRGFKAGKLLEQYRSPGQKDQDERDQLTKAWWNKDISPDEYQAAIAEINRRKTASMPKSPKPKRASDPDAWWEKMMPGRSVTDGMGIAGQPDTSGIDLAGIALQRAGANHASQLAELDAAYKEWEKTAIDATSKVDVAWKNLNSEAVNKLQDSIVSLGDAFVDSFTQADFSWKKFFNAMAADLAKSSIRGLIKFGLGAAGIGGYGHGGDFEIPHAATGANWMVGGAGGTDSKLAMFHVTPGEHVFVRTPEQMNAAENAANDNTGGARHITINMNRDGVVTHDQLEELVIRVIDRHPALASRWTGK